MKLTSEEREVIVTYNDAERAWHVFSDSATMRGTVLKLARQVGAEVKQAGQGVEFDCPGEALKLAAKRRRKLSPDQREAQAARARRHLFSERSAGARTRVLAGSQD